MEDTEPFGGHRAVWRTQSRLEDTEPFGGHIAVWRTHSRLEDTEPFGGHRAVWRTRSRLEDTEPFGGHRAVSEREAESFQGAYSLEVLKSKNKKVINICQTYIGEDMTRVTSYVIQMWEIWSDSNRKNGEEDINAMLTMEM